MSQSTTEITKTGIVITGPEKSRKLAENIASDEIQSEFQPMEETAIEPGHKITFQHLQPAMKKAAKNTDVHLIIGLDDAGDKIAIAVRKVPKGAFMVLNVNQLAAILIDDILEGQEEKSLHILQSIHISEMIEQIARKNHLPLDKLIVSPGEILKEAKKLAKKGEKVFAVSENQEYFYSEGGIKSLITQVSLLEGRLRSQGYTLFDRLILLYGKHGFYKEKTFVRDISTDEQKKHAKEVMDNIRQKPSGFHPAFDLTKLVDYRKGLEKNFLTGKEIPLSHDKHDILELHLEDGAQITLMPLEDIMHYHISIPGGTIRDKRAYADTNLASERRIVKLVGTLNQL